MLIVLLLGVMISCSAIFSLPVSTEVPVNNQLYRVDYLFEYDGCKVYRFYDRGQYVYFTNCQGSDSTAARVTNSVMIAYDDYGKNTKKQQ